MKVRQCLFLVSFGLLSVARAEPDDPPPAKPPAVLAPGAAVAPGAVAVPGSPPRASAAGGPQYLSEDRWEHAGYNQDEIVYTVFITNHDTNILRCRTEVHGFYFNNGTKGEITDVQTSTVFPDKQVQAGIWSGMDEPSGATYKVSCRTI